ncbi:sensor histidine kinase [Ethanoligenens harbinense]|uniref:histidine kinase n=1 Tax=Ethanoligenens harbinense (strain DSM 18485 / JCM 12961 / CGMCC 1.5033 / YUAN-3) TaxID=663278 RepID=E6U324_ETHHY|nr:sensor histidine kinase [Ethanoligenens harbinense]ADU26391.1 integral membrane sensor signal transduction histidine kinase [Ethanoligenens harbinense YUAN-3]
MYKRLFSIYVLMCVWNLGAIVFLCIVTIHASYLTCDTGTARAFLNQVSVVPNSPWWSAALALGGYLALIAVLFYKRAHLPQHANLKWIAVAFEALLAVLVSLALNLSYSGILLLIIIDLMTGIQAHERRLALLAISLILYIFADYNIISLQIPMVSFQQYLTGYSTALQNLLLGIRSVFSSVNIILFLLYVLILMRTQQKETQRIRQLNERVNRANEKLKQMNTKLVDYAQKTEKIAEVRERNRLAREIHDTIGHSLTGISAGIDACITMIDLSPESTKEQLARISTVARQGIKDVRRSVSKLRPDMLENMPLDDALRQMIEAAGTATQTAITYDNQAGPLHFDPDEEDTVYRVVQESITNAIRHGKAKRIYVTLGRKEKWLLLTIRDTGRGCSGIQKGFGLQHMEERVGLLGGSVSYDNGSGFTVSARIPIRWG